MAFIRNSQRLLCQVWIKTNPFTTDTFKTSIFKTSILNTSILNINPFTTDSISTKPFTTNPITTKPFTTIPFTNNPFKTNPFTTNPFKTNTFTTNPFSVRHYAGDCDRYIQLEKRHAANIYDTMNAVICRGEGSRLYDVNGTEYLDFIAGFASVNTGHVHPKILACLKEQASTLHLTSRAVYNTDLPVFAEFITSYFNYDKVIPMNTGVEAADTAIKVARRWGYLTKGIPENQAIVVMVTCNFWGRSLAAISSSTKPIIYEHFGPYMPGFGLIPYDNTCALEEALCNPNVCAFMVEPILGEGGVIVPCDRYLSSVRKITQDRNVLWIADEIQTGLGRTGALLAVDHERVRPDILVLGKALGGGFLPVSAVLANDDVMCHMTCHTHGSTFGGNPLAARVAIKTLEVIRDECLVENAKCMGEKFKQDLVCRLPKDIVPQIRGKGLMLAIVINPEYGRACEFTERMKNCGLLAKAVDDCTIRFTPPLTICEDEICRAVTIIGDVINSCKNK